MAIADRNTLAQIERFLALTAHQENRLPRNTNDSVIRVLSKDGGALIRTSAWQAWAADQDQLIYYILEALGQVFVEAFAGTVFHGAAIDLGRGAVVIQGPALSGKTALLYRAWRRGLSVISDDRVTIGSDCQTVQPFPRCLKLRCGGNKDLAALVEGIAPDLRVKTTIGSEPRVIFARSLPGFTRYDDSHPIKALIQIERTTGQTRLEAIEPSAALQIAQRNIAASDFNPMAVVRLIKSQAEQGSLYRLAIGAGQTEAALDLLPAI
ncbi:MAG: hypothetical protein EXQ99_07370 [Alphaproteobacteria bacterium]|nr:hypothetical protein [Alphaproteobacteria bacterium]